MLALALVAAAAAAALHSASSSSLSPSLAESLCRRSLPPCSAVARGSAEERRRTIQPRGEEERRAIIARHTAHDCSLSVLAQLDPVAQLLPRLPVAPRRLASPRFTRLRSARRSPLSALMSQQQQQGPPGLSPAVAAPPGLGGMGGPPGLQTQQNPAAAYGQQMQGQQGQGQQGQFPPQPDLSSIGPHTSAAQLAQLLASVGNQQGPDLSGAGDFNRGPQQQQQQGGFGGNSWNGGMSNGGGHGGMGGMGGGGGATGPVQHPCRMHQQGHCRYGATCRFMHVGPAGSGGGQQGGFGNKFGGGHNAFGSGFGGQGAFGGHGGNGGGYGGNSFQSRDQEQKADSFNSGAAFPPAQQQPQQQQQQQFGGGAAGNPAAALLQTLLLQQQLTASQGLPANPELDNLVASLTKSAGAAPAAAASSAPAAASASSSSAPADSSLNNEFRQAQQALASLALGGAGAAGARPPQQQQAGIGFPSYAQRNAPSAAGFNAASAGPNYGNKHNQHHGGQSSYGAPSFHAGGNFNAGASPAFGGVAQQIRFFSDANNRDQRRELELFGPAHTTTTGINFDKYNDIPVEVTGNDVPGEVSKRGHGESAARGAVIGYSLPVVSLCV